LIIGCKEEKVPQSSLICRFPSNIRDLEHVLWGCFSSSALQTIIVVEEKKKEK
jgi:hypothetical protein